MAGLDFSDTGSGSGFNVRACYAVDLHVMRIQHFKLAGPLARRVLPPHVKERSLLVSAVAKSVLKAFKNCMLSFFCMSLQKKIIAGIIFSDFHIRM